MHESRLGWIAGSAASYGTCSLLTATECLLLGLLQLVSTLEELFKFITASNSTLEIPLETDPRKIVCPLASR